MTVIQHTDESFTTFIEEWWAEHNDDHGMLYISVTAPVTRWLARGDGVAIYQNAELGHPEMGDIQIVSYGSPEAMLEVEEPPQTLPDIGGKINFRYQLAGTYRSQRAVCPGRRDDTPR
jgi:hypothetical protein